MPNRPYDLPPMSALVAFEAAARHVSFKAAARELNVTPAAISHQVKALEAELQCGLFQRHHRGVALTETGAYLLVAVQRGFEAMDDAIGQLKRRVMRASVTIGVTTAVSSLWLTPQLAQFWKAHGEVSVAQIVDDTGEPPADCDLSISYGPMPRDPSQAHLMFRDHVMALASPHFAAANQVSTLAELARLPLIHFDSGVSDWTDWPGWFCALGYAGKINTAHRVNNYVIALQAARDDMGVVLGWVGLTRSYLETGALAPMLPHKVNPAEQFHVRISPHASHRARLVYDWLVQAATAEPGHNPDRV